MLLRVPSAALNRQNADIFKRNLITKDYSPFRPTNVEKRRTITFKSVGASHSDTAPPVSNQAGLIFGLGEPGSWDEAGVGHPVVRYYLGDNEQRWFMWYTGKSTSCHNIDDIYPSSGSIGVAVSNDGINWSRGRGSVEGTRGAGSTGDVGKVLAPNSDWWWHDTCHMHVSDVQILSNSSVSSGTGVYWCFYSGGNFEEGEVPEGMVLASLGNDDAARDPDQSTTPRSQDGSSSSNNNNNNNNSVKREGFTLRPGLAMSQDGKNFARIEADHHTGALFDVGKPGEWDALFIGSPQVVAAGPKDMRMYYHSYDKNKQKYVVGLATSKDGFQWKKQGPIFEGGRSNSSDFDALGVTSRSVVRDIDTKKFYMFYEAVAQDGTRSIGLAVSNDGLQDWVRHPDPILVGNAADPDAWDSGAVGTPCAVSMAKGKWRLYYSGRKNGKSGAWQGIGVALSDDDSPTKFNRRTTIVDKIQS